MDDEITDFFATMRMAGLASFLLIATTACQPNPPTPWTEDSLPRVICQAEDFTSLRWSSDGEKPGAPQLEQLGEPVGGYQARLLESSLTNFVLACEMAVYADETTAQRAFDQACDPVQPTDPPEVGEEVCAFRRDWNSAPNQWVFRRDTVLVLLQGDIDLLAPAQAVDERLENND